MGVVVVSLLYAVILDLKRQSDTLMLRLDKVFQKIAGLDDYPVQSTISRFLELISKPILGYYSELGSGENLCFRPFIMLQGSGLEVFEIGI